MKISSEIMKKAHNLTKEIKAEYPSVDYKTQLGICISYLCKEENEMVELKGSEKQVKWAEDIRKNLIVAIKAATDYFENMQKDFIEGKGHRSKRIDRRLNPIRELMNEVENTEKASWFIDNYMCMTNKNYTAIQKENVIIEYSLEKCNYERLN